MKLPSQENPNPSQLIIYQAQDGKTRLEVRLDKETVWLALNQMADLFQRDKSVISRHIRNVFEEGELPRERTVANFATVQQEGEREVSREIEFFNLDVIISVGYRVKSHRGTQFRKSFSPPCRTKCTGRRTATRRQKLSRNEPMPRSRTWV